MGKFISEIDIIHIEIYYIMKLALQMCENNGLSYKHVGTIGQLQGGEIMLVLFSCPTSK